jgi:outer membrane biosynthesis protein TonB
MKKTLLALLLSCQTSILVLAQQPATRQLTPAEQRQKEKIDREVQRERQIRAEWAQKQREYEAKQAEKRARKAAKDQEKNAPAVKEEKVEPTLTPAPGVTTPTSTAPSPAVTPAPEPEKPAKVKKEKRQKEVVAPEVKPEPVKTPRPRRERPAKPVKPAVDSTSAVTATGAEPEMARPKHEFLPKGHLFDPILLDPLEAQTYGSVLPAYYTNGEKYPGSIVPFAFGFAKPFYRRTTEPGHSEELVLDLASFTQFEVYYDYQRDKQRRQIINNDYKISFIYNIRRGDNNYRIRVYHLSSHLGDDYVYRNRITAPSPNSVNYEVLDGTYSRVVRDWRLYGGIGIGLRKAEERKRFSAQLGAYYKKPSSHAARLVGGVDVKFWQETSFKPGIHAGIGVEVGRTQNNLTFLLEGYSGFRPYSQYETQHTNWLGLGLYLNPF